MSSAPRPPIQFDPTAKLDYTDNYLQKMLDWREAARFEARRELEANREYSRVQRYIDAIEGKQSRRGGGSSYRSEVIDNMLSKARTDNLAMLSDVHPTLDVFSRIDDASAQNQAHICTDSIHAQWDIHDMDLRLVSTLDHALFGVGYWKLGATIGTEDFPAAVTVKPCGMDSVMPIHHGDTFQESEGVLYQGYKPPQWFRNRWGDAARGIERYAAVIDTATQGAAPGAIGDYSWQNMRLSTRFNMNMGVSKPAANHTANAFPVVRLEEYWTEDWAVNESSRTVIVKDPYLSLNSHNYWYAVEPGQRLFPRKRLVIFGGDQIMYDSTSPYWHGLYPFAELILNPVVWAPAGLSKYRNLLPLHNAINEISSGVGETVRKAIHQTVVTRKGAIPDEAWNRFRSDLDGSKLMLNPMGDPQRDVRYVDPPNLPAWLFQWGSGYLMPQFERHAGTLDAGGLARKNQVPGADAIESMREMQAPNLRLEGRFVERFLKDAGAQAVSHIFQFFNRRDRMRTLGADGISYYDFIFDPKDMIPSIARKESWWRMFPLYIAQGSLLGSSRDREMQIAMLLRRMGSISNAELLRKLKWGNIQKITEELQQEHKEGIGIPPGRQPRTSGQRRGRA